MKRTMTWSCVALLMATGTVGCSAAQRAGAGKTVASVLISDDQELAIGKQVKAQLEQEGLKYVEDPTINGYVEKLATPIFQAANASRKVPWKLYVIDDPKTVNAFATPGGYIYVYTGLLMAADNDAEIAGVLGHEAAHVTERHSARALVNQYGIEGVTQLALGKNAGLLSQIGSQLAGQGLMLANSRGAENEADHAGARFTNKAGFDPRGLASFFNKLKQEQGKTPAALTFLSTHPDPGERVKNVNRIIAEENLKSTGGQSATTLKQVQARIQGR